MNSDFFDAVIIGGGYYGCSLALQLRRYGLRVLLLEQHSGLLRRASHNNQARVHNGYHYPRSLLTAYRSRTNFPRFVRDFESAVVRSFDKYYAIGRRHSKVNAEQFRVFCRRIGAPLAPAPAKVRALFNADLVEDVFKVEEFAFDAVILARLIEAELQRAGVPVMLESRCQMVRALEDRGFELDFLSSDATEHTVCADRVFNCTYSALNRVISASGLDPVPLKHELTEMALIDVPEPLKGMGVTVMCGPFFSVMPFPPTGQHTLSHVRYTPHTHWADRGGAQYRDVDDYLARAGRRSHFTHMQKDAVRYLPLLGEARHRDSLWEIKTLLPRNETDDGRPILFHADRRHPGFISVLGGKIDNIYDVQDEVDDLYRKSVDTAFVADAGHMNAGVPR